MVEQEEVFYILSISGKDQAFVSLTLNGSASVTFQIDTGSSANILPLQDYIRATQDFSKANIVPKEITLVMHDHSKQKALGFARLKVEHKGIKHELNFVIVDQEVTPLLGLKSSQGMGLVKIMVPGADSPVNNVVAAPKIESAVSENVTKDPILSPFADVFQGIGCLPGEYNIKLNKDVQPVVHPRRRVPVPTKEAMKTELDQMVADKIATPVTEPTDWVSSVLAVPKKDGSVCICLHPKDLNTAIKCSHYPLPTVPCVMGDSKHHKLQSCPKFKALSVLERLEKVKDYGLCFRCFGRHWSNKCGSTKQCGVNGCTRLQNELFHRLTSDNGNPISNPRSTT